MPAQYALTYYLGSAILGSVLLAIITFLAINIPNGTFYLDEFGISFLISCAIAMVGSLPFHAWLNWVWYKKVGSQTYEDFFQSFLRKYWLGSTLCLVFLYASYVVYFIFQIQENGGSPSAFLRTHILGGERGEVLAEASKEALNNAVAFTEAQIKEEKGDISRAGARIVEHLQNEAIRKSREVQKAAELKAQEVARDISDAPSHLVDEGKKFVQSEDFRQMPKRTFKAVSAFLGSDKVKRAKQKVIDSIKDGLESEEMQAMREKATRSLTNM